MDSRRFLWLNMLTGLVAIALLAGAFVLVFRGANHSLEAGIDGLDVSVPALTGEPQTFSVKEGETAIEIGKRLEEQGLIRSAACSGFGGLLRC